jgi:hypothetical protein
MNYLPEETHFSNTLSASMFYEMKQCSKCGEKKLLTEFNIDQGKKDGRQSYCRLCQEDYRLQRFYKISRQQRDLMYEQQQGRCASCHLWYPQLYIYAFEGLGVISLVCPRCMRICNGFHRNPDIIMSAVDYLDYFGSRVLYGVALRINETWEEDLPTGEQPRKTRNRHYPRGVNPETYDCWSSWNNHQCYICWEPRSTEQALAKDHNHSTDRNRGLLCLPCNTTLGIAKENKALLHACATFLHAYLDPYILVFVRITDAMVADAQEEAPWVSCAYSAILPAPQIL